MPVDSTLTGDAAAAAEGFAETVRRIGAGELTFPLPGSGRTAERFAALSSVAEAGLCTARLVEGHVDAMAIRAELGEPRRRRGSGGAYGQPSLRARVSPLSGTAPSGC